MGCFSGRLMSSASDQKLFCEVCSAFNCSFDEFVGEKVVSPSYSSAILAPPPASYLQRGWGGSSLEILSPFVLRTASGVFRPVNSSLALPKFKKKLPPTALRAFWPVPTLSNAAGSSPFRPLLLVAGADVWGTFLLGVAFST